MLSTHFDYKRWADSRTLQAISKINKSKYPEQYGFVLQQLNHMIIVEDLFRARILGEPEPHENTNSETVPALEVLSERLTLSGEWYLSFSLSPENESRERPITFTFKDGIAGAMTVDEILFHIINHGSYHRGNIAHALDLAQVPHPVDGFGIYLHHKEPWRRD